MIITSSLLKTIGDDGDNFYVVDEGQVEVVKNGKIVNLLG
jgi:hypothetical protein